jgi:PEP-CTERM motif
MRKSLLFMGTIALASPAMAATNLVTNGGFEAGNAGFTSTYNYVAPNAGLMVPENTYTVALNAANQHPSWANVAAFAGNNFLIANGSPSSDAPVWMQMLTGLTIGTTYNFSAMAVNVCCNSSFGGPNVSPLLISIGSNVAPTTIATSGALGSTGVWSAFTGSFVANSTTANLSIFTDTSAASGNDFGLDEISVTAAVPEPATWMMMLIGMAGVGFSMRRKDKQTLRVRYT